VVEVRNEVILASLVFAIAVIVSATLPPEVRDMASIEVERTVRPFEEAFSVKPFETLIALPVIILYNNFRVAVINIALGPTIVVPIAITAFNGFYITSFVMSGNVIENSLLIIPHGVVEIPAFILSAAIGLKLGFAVILRGLRLRDVSLAEVLALCIRYLSIVLMLFAIAALIETFLTPSIYAAYKVLTSSSLGGSVG